MKHLAIIALAIMLVWSPARAAAQDAVDVAAVGEQVATVDPERLLMRLNTPIPDDILPAGFAGAKPLSDEMLPEQRARFDTTFPNLNGSVFYTVKYTPAAASGTPVRATASPAARGPKTAFTSGTLTYLLFDAPVDEAQMSGLGDQLQQALGTDAQSGTVEMITVNDAPAILVSSTTVVNALEFHIEWIAVPVGSVVVVAMVTEGSETFDDTRFRNDNEALAISGVAYLQRIVDDMAAA